MINNMKFEIEGVHETINKLDFTKRKVTESANGALREGAEVIENTIQRNTPLGDGHHGEHAKDEVIKGNVTMQGTYKSIKVGYTPAVAWRMWFLEEGTYSKGSPKGISPRKIVEKSQAEAQAPVERIIADFIGTAIDMI